MACGGYIYWRRRGHSEQQTSLPLHFPSRAPTGIRLSEDGPPATTFTHDNASTDSLPTHALQEIPELQQPTPLPYSDNHPLPLSHLPSKASSILGIGKHRRSAKGKRKGPIEDEEISEEEGTSKFGIGDEGDGASESDDSGDGDELGPLGNK
nr:hypothetical protein I302_06929 [Kwoniella bestiolae CBS 10118]OCF23943.1 hypothetical protein I302_06929 [Kwoniella bestiolae CBS 10118]